MIRTASKSQILRRSIATQAAPKPQITKLSNGTVVATESNPASATSSVGVVFGSGSAAENPYNNGVSNLLGHVFRTENGAQTAQQGFLLSSQVGRDFQSYVATSRGSSPSSVLELLQKKLSTGISDASFAASKDQVLKEVDAFETQDHAGKVLEHLHSTAFQNTPLSLPVRGTREAIETLEKADLESFAKNHFLASNAVIVGSGNVSHDELVKAVESQVSLASGEKPILKKQSSFLGSEVRLRDDTLPAAWISIAAEGEPVSSPNYYVAQVAAEIFGSFVASEPASRLQGIKLLDTIQEYHDCDSYDHFSLSYKDSGLWGFSTVISNFHAIDDMVHFTLKQWNRLTVSITPREVARGKALLKLKLASAAKDNASIATNLGAQTLALGSKPALADVFAKIDAIEVSDVKKWASDRLWDQDIAIAATGQIEGLLDYMRIRADMSMMRW
ncbi:LAMI_0C04698g1_1 [Lachancea mirantina]|uniref:LAMI_0C04698g1_1 n=1 Tax=Lachancea mirantina TaxID=1230905 RepID=A0A1G4J284_9SACH|nr:LAMI_0C04698g1_1 [Lachancea mirantina]